MRGKSEIDALMAQWGDMGGSEAGAVFPDKVISWPLALLEQVSAVQSAFAVAPKSMVTQDIARALKGKCGATVRPVLDALTGTGIARRFASGRVAA